MIVSGVLFIAPMVLSVDRLRMLCGLSSGFELHCRELSPGVWRPEVAARNAIEISIENQRSREWIVAVLFGPRSARAFRLPYEPFRIKNRISGDLIMLPMLSPLERACSATGAFERARDLLRDACPSVPWGEIYAKRTKGDHQ